MSPQIPFSLVILKEACLKNGYDFKIFDSFGNNLAKISNGKKTYYAGNGNPGTFPLNLSFASRIARDKAWTNKILNKSGFKVIMGEHFFVNDNNRSYRKAGREIVDALRYAKGKYPLFVKPNDSVCGIFAEPVYKQSELRSQLKEISSISNIALVQEIHRLPEYRLYVVDGEVMFMYRRESPVIIGNRKEKIKNLITEFNKGIRKKKNHISLRSKFLLNELKRKKLNLNSRLLKGEELQIALKSNLSSGGEIAEYRKKANKEINNWAKLLTDAMSLRICGIDVFVDGSVEDPKNYTVIEVNANPGLAGIYRAGFREDALKISGSILGKFFKN